MECGQSIVTPPPPTVGKKLFLSKQDDFGDVSRPGAPHKQGPGKPPLKGEELVKARLTPETWRLEIVGDGKVMGKGGAVEVPKPRRLEDNTAIDYATLLELGKKHGVKFLKAMQCSNIDQPLGQGLWEGVPLREVLKLAGRLTKNIRRVYYWGYHSNDPKLVFQSSLSYNAIMEPSPWELTAFLAYRLNGQPLTMTRGAPVRMVVPWAHGFKSIKWLQRIVLTNDHQANDTYGDQNNDVESILKTAAYIDKGSETGKAGEPFTLAGNAMVGISGLKRVEYWLRPDAGTHGKIDDNDPAWQTAKWEPCAILPPPDDWGGALPNGVMPKDVWGFDPATGKPKEWPMRYSWANWSVTLKGLKPGAYEFRVRTVDLNGFAQPEPRPYLKSGRNPIQVRQFMVMA